VRAFAAVLLVMGCATQESKSALEADPKGWIDLFPDKDLKGWTRADFDPKVTKKVWGVSDDGKLLEVDGRGHVKEYLVHEKESADGIFHVEWRWGKDQGDKPEYNGGILVRSSADAKTWVQAQVARGSKPPVVGDFILVQPLDGKPQRKDYIQKGANREAPVGEWNTYEITCRGRTVTLWVNGAVTATLEDCPITKGHPGIQAEFALYEFRSIKFKPLN
jgi:hypothetical protein